MAGEITPIATFGEDAAMEAEEDCWLLLGDITKTVLSSVLPPDRRPCRGKVVAFPGRARKAHDRGNGG